MEPLKYVEIEVFRKCKTHAEFQRHSVKNVEYYPNIFYTDHVLKITF